MEDGFYMAKYISEIISAVLGFFAGYGFQWVKGSKDVSSENAVTQSGNQIIGGKQAGRDIADE
jgi:hypothetical protein